MDIMPFVNNTNAILSVIGTLVTIITTIIGAFSKQSSIQTTIQNSYIPINIRNSLQERWSGPSFIVKIIYGIVGGLFSAILAAFLITYIINTFFVISRHFKIVADAISSSDPQQMMKSIGDAMTNFLQIFSFPDPTAITIGIVLGFCIGILSSLHIVTGGSQRYKGYKY